MEKIKDNNERLDIGLTSISIGDFKLFRPNEHPRLGCLRVVDNETRLLGLISEEGEEILPCIFDDIDVKHDGIIEVHFKGRYYTLKILIDYEPSPKGEQVNRFFSKKWYYELDICADLDFENESDLNKAVDLEMGIVPPDDTTQQLITLLNVRHSVNQDQ